MLRIYARLLAAVLVAMAVLATVRIPNVGLGGRLRLRRLSARGHGAGEKRGGGYGLAVFGVGAAVGAGDGRRGVPLRGEVLGGGARARRPRGVYDGVRCVIALRRRRGAGLPLGSHPTTS
jgi:hypothetical protein